MASSPGQHSQVCMFYIVYGLQSRNQGFIKFRIPIPRRKRRIKGSKIGAMVDNIEKWESKNYFLAVNIFRSFQIGHGKVIKVTIYTSGQNT